MQVKHIDDAYELYTLARAEQENRAEAKVKSILQYHEFEQTVQQLYEAWISGEISFGRYAELMNVPHWELWEILDTLGLPRFK